MEGIKHQSNAVERNRERYVGREHKPLPPESAEKQREKLQQTIVYWKEVLADAENLSHEDFDRKHENLAGMNANPKARSMIERSVAGLHRRLDGLGPADELEKVAA